MRARRVGIIAPEYPPEHGGAGWSTKRIARLLSVAGYEVHVLVSPGLRFQVGQQTQGLTRATIDTGQDGAVLVHRLRPAVRRTHPKLPDWRESLFDLVLHIARTHELDLLHCFHISSNGTVAALVASDLSIPLISSVRGNDLHSDLLSAFTYSDIIWAIDKAKLVTFVGSDLLERADRLFGCREKSRLILNSVDPTDFRPLDKSFHPYSHLHRPVIGTAGIFRAKKGVECLVDACNRLSKDLAFSLVLVGDFRHIEMAYWKDVVLGELEPSIQVHITGLVDHQDILNYLGSLDIYVQPSIHDGCPNTLLEAMLAGCAVVGSRVGGIADILAKSETGILVEPGDSVELANAILDLVTSHGTSRQMGNKARSYVIEHHRPEIEIAHWLDSYAEVLKVSA